MIDNNRKNGIKVDELDNLFKLMEKLMKENFEGGYSRDPQSFIEQEEDEEEIVDVYEDKKHLYITIELRGVQEEDISVDIKPFNLLVNILYNGRVLENNIKLPCKVKPKGKIKFNNYVLDVTLTKEKRKKNGNKKSARIGTNSSKV